MPSIVSSTGNTGEKKNFAALVEMESGAIIGDKLNRIYSFCLNDFCKKGNGKLLEGSK